MCDDHHAHKPPPRWALGAMLGLAALATILAFAAPLVGGKQHASTPATVAIAMRAALHFDDLDAGRVVVAEAKSGQAIAVLRPGTFGFVRTVMRSLAQNRLRAGSDRSSPFEIARTAGGQIYVSDPETGKSIYLNAFSLTNARSFGRLLDAAVAARERASYARLDRPAGQAGASPGESER